MKGEGMLKYLIDHLKLSDSVMLALKREYRQLLRAWASDHRN